jgi:signal transduction histidine kinase
LPADQVFAILEDSYNRLWILGFAGVAVIDKKSLNEWDSERRLRLRPIVYRNSAGLQLRGADIVFPNAVPSRDGHLWFSSADGLLEMTVSDPATQRAPQFPVLVEEITVDQVSHSAADRIRMPAGSRSIEIRYTALTFSDPEAVRFRYRLEGIDDGWVDADTRRVAFYNNLKPGAYKFRVAASTDGGQWQEASALGVEQVPYFYQTIWFFMLASAAVLSLGYFLFRLRLRQTVNRVQAAFQERMHERTRIARDLHDTLLQSLAGVSLQLNGVSKQVAPVSEKAAALIGRIQEQVDACFREARGKVWNLRSPELEVFGLEASLRQLTERIGASTTAGCDLIVSGQPRPVKPDVEEELLRIAQEAANNASRHAEPNQIRIALDYGGNTVMLSICDDGRGFHLEEGLGKSGHWGLKNMQERAAGIGSTCKITTAAGQGTRIEICVPLTPVWSLRNTRAKHAHSGSSS